MNRRFNLFMPLAAVLMMAACGNDMNGDDPRPEPQPEQPAPSAAHAVAVMDITTENGAPIKGKEKEDYVNCTINVDHPDDKWDYEGTGRIRGRGNSTWLWYDKKPYRIKLDEKASIVGLAAEKDWVLLANFRDPTHMMNTFVFELGHVMGLPYTNHSRFMEVNLNGEYIGLYQLTEQIEQGKNRVAVDDMEGILIALDADDGPYYSPDSGDNFYSDIYGMPVCVKFPEDTDVSDIRSELAKLESAILSIRRSKGDEAAIKTGMDKVRELLDVQSFIDYLIIQELIYNVELAAPRSMYMHKDKGGKWVMGPLWDFDAGFDFDWGTMYDGHNYFDSYRKLMLGKDPIHHNGGNGGVPEFFTDIFRSDEFCEEFIARWKEISPLIMTEVWDNTEKYITAAEDAMIRNSERWPIYFPSDSWPEDEIDFEEEIDNLYVWLTERIDYLTPIFNKYVQLD
ncbi:MAG: CotH kinase family protein [Bacteroidales bacterium]|nr:CotH kinase family protein [Bacteroidales bacterium]